jgi:hypothetical protein
VSLPAEDGRLRRPSSGPALILVWKVLTTKLTSTCASGVAVAVGRSAVLWELSLVEQHGTAMPPGPGQPPVGPSLASSLQVNCLAG